MPQIELTGVDRLGGGELELEHRHDGRDLELEQAGATLARLAALWGGPVHLRTQEEGQGRLLKCSADGRTELVDTSDPPAPSSAGARS